MKRKNLWIAIAVVLVVVIGVVVWQQQQPLQQEEKVIKIGAILPLTGPSAAVGEYSKASALLVKDLYFSKFQDLGVNLELVLEDSKGSPTEAIFAYRKLASTNSDIKVILTQMSSVARALAPLIDQDGKILISISSTLEPLKVTKNFFVNYIDAESQADLYLSFFTNQRQITVFYVNDEYGRSVLAAIERKASGKNLKSFPFEMVTDPKNLVAKAESLGEGVILIGYGTKLADILKNIRIFGYQGPIACSAELLVKDILETLKDYEKGVYVIDFQPLPTDVIDLYRQRLGREPTIGDMLTYNALTLILESYISLIQSGLSPKDIYISHLKSIFSKSEIVAKVPSIKAVRNNILVYDTWLRPLTEK